MEDKLRIVDLRKSYGNVHALRKTSLNVPQGQFLTLLGPSGSGKTTMLMILAGLVLPDGGEVWIDGKQSTYLPSYDRDVGMIFQNYALFPHMTIFENIAFPLRMRRVPAQEISRRVHEMLEIVQLPHVADRLPKALSGGQQQRIALARSTIYQPSIILMDEPLGALDKKLRDHMQLEIKRLHTTLGITVIYVTHDQEEAMAMSDRICLMSDGAIEQIGAPQELYFRPRTAFVADFLGGANIFEGRVIAVEDGVSVVRGPAGAVVRCINPNDVAVTTDSQVRFMVRPEHITFLPRSAAASEKLENSMTVTLDQSVMTGALVRHYGRAADGTTVLVTHLAQGFVEEARGEDIRIHWSRESSVLLHDGGTAT